MKKHTYFLILFFLNTSTYLLFASHHDREQLSRSLLSPYSFQSSFQTMDLLTNRPLQIIEGISLDKILAAVIRRENATTITLESKIGERVRELSIELQDPKNWTLTTARYQVAYDHPYNSSNRLPSLFDHASLATNAPADITRFTTANLEKIFIDNNHLLPAELKNTLASILFCTTAGKLQFIPQAIIPRIADESRKDNTYVSRKYPNLDPRALSEIARELEQSSKPSSITLKPKIETTKPSSCFK